MQKAYKCNVEQTKLLVLDCSMKKKGRKSHVEQTYPQGIICSTPLDISARTDSSSSYFVLYAVLQFRTN